MSLDTYAGVEGYHRWNQQLNARFQPPGNPYSTIPSTGLVTDPVLYQTDQMAREAINAALATYGEEDRKIKASIVDVRGRLEAVKNEAALKKDEVDAAMQLTYQEKHAQDQDRRKVAHEEASCRALIGQGERIEEKRASELTQQRGRFEAEFQGDMHVINLRIRYLADAIEELERNKEKK